MEKFKEVSTYETRLYCDNCGAEMVEVNPGVVLMSFPPKYAYHCQNSECPAKGVVVYTDRQYSYISYGVKRHL